MMHNHLYLLPEFAVCAAAKLNLIVMLLKREGDVPLFI
jgi:hypothetical protein